MNYLFNQLYMTYYRKGKISIPQGKEKFEFVYSYVLLKFKSWYNHGIRLEIRINDQNNLTEIKIKIPKLKSFNITNFRCYTNHVWEFVANVK